MATSATIGRPSRPQTPSNYLVARIDTSQPLFAIDTPDFSGFVQGQLGDLGTGTDGFDALYAIPAGSIDSDITALSGFDDILSALAFNIGDFAGTYFAPIDGLLPTFLSDGDTLNDTVQALDLVTGQITITPPPAPPIDISTGGSGGGGQIYNGPGPTTGDNSPNLPWEVPIIYYL